MEVELIEVGKRWVQDHHPQDTLREHDPDKPLKPHGTAEYIELTHHGVPYRIPHMVDGKPTIKKAAS